jgi:hypothetical protein
MSIQDVRAHLAKHPATEALDAQRAQDDKAERFFKLPPGVLFRTRHDCSLSMESGRSLPRASEVREVGS